MGCNDISLTFLLLMVFCMADSKINESVLQTEVKAIVIRAMGLGALGVLAMIGVVGIITVNLVMLIATTCISTVVYGLLSWLESQDIAAQDELLFNNFFKNYQVKSVALKN